MIWLDGIGVVVAIAAGIVGGMWALYQLGHRVNAAMRRQDKIDRLIQRELGDDGNGSMKSQVTKTTAHLALMNEKLDLAKEELRFLQHTVDTHIADVMIHAYDPNAHRRDDGTPDEGGAGPR